MRRSKHHYEYLLFKNLFIGSNNFYSNQKYRMVAMEMGYALLINDKKNTSTFCAVLHMMMMIMIMMIIYLPWVDSIQHSNGIIKLCYLTVFREQVGFLTKFKYVFALSLFCIHFASSSYSRWVNTWSLVWKYNIKRIFFLIRT